MLTCARSFTNRYLMPWQLPEEDVDEAWDLISRKILRWESRLAGGIGLALDEVCAAGFRCAACNTTTVL